MPGVVVSFPLQLIRQQAAPVDVDATFNSMTELNAYLASPRRYAGQLATIQSPSPKAFILNAARDAWVEVGSSVADLPINHVLVADDYFDLADGTLTISFVLLPDEDITGLLIGTTLGGSEISAAPIDVPAATGLVFPIMKYAIPGGDNRIYFTNVSSELTVKVYKK